jgi:hypothetical protein
MPAVCAALTGVLNLASAPAQLQLSWVTGAVAVLTGMGQLGLALALTRVLRLRTLVLAVGANIALVCLYVVTRTLGVPFGLTLPDELHQVHHLPVPGASGNGVPVFPQSHVLPVGTLDLLGLLGALVLVMTLVGMLPGPLRRLTATAMMGLGLLALSARALGLLG